MNPDPTIENKYIRMEEKKSGSATRLSYELVIILYKILSIYLPAVGLVCVVVQAVHSWSQVSVLPYVPTGGLKQYQLVLDVHYSGRRI